MKPQPFLPHFFFLQNLISFSLITLRKTTYSYGEGLILSKLVVKWFSITLMCHTSSTTNLAHFKDTCGALVKNHIS